MSKISEVEEAMERKKWLKKKIWKKFLLNNNGHRIEH